MLRSAKIEWTARKLYKMAQRNEITFDNAVQRGFVWDNKKKSLLIHSMLSGYPIPPFYAAKNENGTNVQVYRRNQTDAQKWKLIPISAEDSPSTDTVEPNTPGKGHWGPWSEWSTNYVEPSATREVETGSEVKVADGHTEYRYGRYVDSTGSHGCWCAKYLESRSYTSGSAVLQYSDWSATQYYANRTGWTCGYCRGDHIGVHHIGSDGRAWWAEFELPDGSYYWEETKWVDAVYAIQYRYRDWIFE